MNVNNLRKLTVPLTPNLEDYKQKNKSRSRRKGCIQPTNPPTPKIPRAPLTLKSHNEPKEQQHCPMHPDRTATRFIDNSKTKFCTKCYLLTTDDVRPEEVQFEKKRELDEFRQRIKSFGLKLQEAQQQVRRWSKQSDQNYYFQKQYITQCFQKMKVSLQEKQRQLLSILMSSQQQIKRNLIKGGQQVEQIKKAISRYMEDIQSHYEDIIEALSYEQFNQIIEKYNNKIRYFEGEIEEISGANSINVYIPISDIDKYISKSTIQVYPQITAEDTSFKTMFRYPTEKGNIYLDNGSRNYHTQQQSMGKMGHRQSRERQYFQKNIQYKENHNYDNRFF